MSVLAFRAPAAPTTAEAVEEYTPELEVLLGAFAVERLVDAIIVLTHQIHEADGDAASALREQRMLVRLELERRAA